MNWSCYRLKETKACIKNLNKYFFKYTCLKLFVFAWKNFQLYFVIKDMYKIHI